jgi:hypothetical protein
VGVSGAFLVGAPRAIVAFSDPHNARLLNLAAFGLFAVGLLMALTTRFWWRNARREHPVLGRLELMPVHRPPAVDDDAAADAVAAAMPAEVNGSAAGAAVGAQPVLVIDPGLHGKAAATD